MGHSPVEPGARLPLGPVAQHVPPQEGSEAIHLRGCELPPSSVIPDGANEAAALEAPDGLGAHPGRLGQHLRRDGLDHIGASMERGAHTCRE